MTLRLLTLRPALLLGVALALSGGLRAQDEVVPAPPAPTFEGVWSTRYGRMRLDVDGARVRGTYAYAGTSSLEGELQGDTLRFTYSQPDGERGEGTFELGEDGRRFTGRWRSADDRGGRWSGTRVEPEPDRTWLVVLEANWEPSLTDPEYSYGAMLRSFFTRLPRVGVRHRFVHDVADLERWCAELAYVPEPVVLYVSSHGTDEGVSLGAETARAEDLVRALAPVRHLHLLHFGSCSVLNGDLPRRVLEARPPEERFPISGYTRPADWGGSAIVDFTYLELVLGRGVPPGEAVEWTRDAVTFAAERAPGPIPGSGLAILLPADVAAQEPASAGAGGGR